MAESTTKDTALRQVTQEYVPAFPLADLAPDPLNPWSGNDDVVGESMDKLGFYGAVLLQASSKRLIAGHTRVRRALARQAATLPALLIDVDDETARRMLLVDNRSNQRGGFMDEPLANLLQLLQANDGGLAGTGFGDDDLADTLNRLAPPPTLDALQGTYGDPVESHIWPLVHIRLPPDHYSKFRDLLEAAAGETDTAKFMAIIDRLAP
jgi:hypothetical protein